MACAASGTRCILFVRSDYMNRQCGMNEIVSKAQQLGYNIAPLDLPNKILHPIWKSMTECRWTTLCRPSLFI